MNMTAAEKLFASSMGMSLAVSTDGGYRVCEVGILVEISECTAGRVLKFSDQDHKRWVVFGSGLCWSEAFQQVLNKIS